MRKTVCAVLAAAFIFVSNATASADTPGVVTADVLCVREGMGLKSAKEGEIYKNTKVNIISSLRDWYKIEYDGATAYVAKEYISDDPEVIEACSMANIGKDIVNYAKTFIGVPYVYGGITPSGFDCSGFVQYVFANFGISLPRVTYDQLNVGADVAVSDLQEGDLVFFRGGDHVGIYVGGGEYIHAPRTGRNITVEPLNRRVYSARRVL